MATAETTPVSSNSKRRLDNASRERLMDWGVTLLGLIFLAGAYWDGWAHNNVPNLIETFFTPYHLLLYGGFGLVALFILGNWLYGLRQGLGWKSALPAGYNIALVGVILFALAGAADMAWHELFGFEEDVEALLSPSHLALVAGGLLIAYAPLQSAWQRSTTRRLRGDQIFPILLTSLLTLSLLTFITQYTHYADSTLIIRRPFGGTDRFLYTVQGIFAFATPLWLLMGMLFLLLRRWELPFGSITLITVVNYTLMYWMQAGAKLTPGSLIAVVIAALVADILLRWLRPDTSRVWQARLFGFLLPALFTICHLLVLLPSGEVWWRIHMWAGIPFLIGAGGLFLSFLFVPPAIPASAQD